MTPPVRLLGPIQICPRPIAVLTSRGTVRTRRPVPNGCQRYPARSPADWLQAGHVTAGVRCIACKHHADLRLDALPSDWSWARVGRALLCTECGTPGFVDIKPNWHDIERFATHHATKRSPRSK
jgi:hypothetical protein